MSSMRNRVTSAHVAQAAGVSRSTVSYVLSGKTSRFPEETRRRVLRVADDLGYRPSSAGRALVTGRSSLVLVLLPDLTFGSHLQDDVDHIVARIAEMGKTAIVRFGGQGVAESVRTAVELNAEAIVDLGVLTASYRESLANSGIRVVPGELADGSRDASGYAAGRRQVKELLRGGPRRLLFANVSDHRGDPLSSSRLSGVRDEARDRGVLDVKTVALPLSRDGSRAALAQALQDIPEGPIGVCCYNDEVAIAVLFAARSLGLDVPRDAAIVGIDHSSTGQLVDPPLTTISIDSARYIDAVLVELEERDQGVRSPAVEDLASLVALVRGGTS